MGLDDELRRLTASNGLTPQRRGQLFERWLVQLLDQERCHPRASFRPKGEEIDGSFVFHGRVYLLEAKWTAEPLPASTIYQYKGKVDGKLVGTIGILVSMGGYSQDAVEALRRGKTLNVVLFDEQDVHAAAQDGFSAVLDFKLRAAAELGEPYVPYLPNKARRLPAIIIVEGPRDAHIVRLLADRLQEEYGAVDCTVTAAMGKLGLPRVARSLAEVSEANVLVITEADDGSDHEGRERVVGRRIFEDRFQLLVLETGVEEWLPQPYGRDIRGMGSSEIVGLARNTDLEGLAHQSPSFGEFTIFLRAEIL